MKTEKADFLDKFRGVLGTLSAKGWPKERRGVAGGESRGFESKGFWAA